MAAPTILSVTQTLIGSLTSNPTLNLDGASVAGDRTIVVAAFGRNRPQGITWPLPWAELLDITNTSGNSMIQSWGWRDGATGSSVQLTTTATQAVWAQAFRLQAGTFDTASSPAVATAVNTGDAPSLDPPWGIEEWLALVSLTRDGSLGTVTFPLPNNQLSTNAGIFGSAAVCTGPITADTYDPAAWVTTTTGTVVTAAVRGAAAGTEHQATLDAALGFSGGLAGSVEHPASLAAPLGFTASTVATREVAAAADAPLGFTAAAAASVEHTAVLSSALGGEGAVVATLDHPGTAAADLGFVSHFDATAAAVHEATLAATLGFVSTAAGAVTHAAALTAAGGFGSTIDVAVSHPAALAAALGFVSSVTATGGTASDPVAAVYAERFGAAFAEPVAATYQEPPPPAFQESA